MGFRRVTHVISHHSAIRAISACGFACLIVVMAAHAAANSAQGWPEFRGPSGDGHVPNGKLPLHWSETDHVKWKTEIPNLGWSTPVVLDKDIWLTSATEDGHDFFALCVDADSGAIRVNKKLFHSDNPEPLGNGVNCYASPSAAIEPGRVYVHFGSYGTACLDAKTGEPIWTRTDFPCRHYRGPGSSPILYKNMLILTFDGVDLQYMVALDKQNGKTLWKTDRTTAWKDFDDQGKILREGDMRKAFSTPLIVEAAGKMQLLNVGSACAYSYEPDSGKEIWKLPMPGFTPSSRPVCADGLVYITCGQGENPLWAVRVDGSGALDDKSIVWRFEGPNVPKETSPILADGLLYIVSNSGVVTCLEAATGTVVYSERIGGNYIASPIYCDGRLYFGSTQGKTTVVKAGRTYESLAVNELEEGFMASPAVQGNALFLRSKTHLYRIED